MSEATAGLLEAAHGTRQFPLIQAQALKSNAASLRVLEKAGFRRRGERNERSGNLRGRPMIVLEQRQ